MAKKNESKKAGKESVKETQVELFYASRDKYTRAVKLAGEKGNVKEEYEKLGGVFSEGHGYTPVK